MATYTFIGFQPTFFNGLRDPDGKQYGYLEPGEIVDITEPPNAFFVPVDVPQATSPDPEPSASPDAIETPVVAAPEVVQPDPQPVPEAAPFQPVNATQAVVH